MTILTTDYFRRHLSEVLRQVRKGQSFALVSGEDNKVIACLLPANSPEDVYTPRPIGLLSGYASFTLRDDFKMSENDFTDSNTPLPQ